MAILVYSSPCDIEARRDLLLCVPGSVGIPKPYRVFADHGPKLIAWGVMGKRGRFSKNAIESAGQILAAPDAAHRRVVGKSAMRSFDPVTKPPDGD